MKPPTNCDYYKRNSAAKLRLKADVQQLLQQELGRCASNDEPFFVVSVDALVQQFHRWQQLMPRVHPFYAVKCNSTPVVLRTLAALGCNFDCASKVIVCFYNCEFKCAQLTHLCFHHDEQGEIDTVLGLGVSAERIIYANPCKTRSYIDHARRVGVDLMTFDNEPELHKIATIFPSARVVLRIKVDDSQSVCRFSAKFGAHMNDTWHLLQVARSLALQVVGVSFHVGSGCESVESYVSAIEDAKRVFEYGNSLGFNMRLLDLGGGYPGTSNAKIPFEPIAATIQTTIDRLFPPTENLQIIAEPGRYFAAGAFTLITQVIAKRDMPYSETESVEALQFMEENEVIRCDPHRLLSKESLSVGTAQPKKIDGEETERFGNDDIDMDREIMYYLNDGVYGSFNCTIFDHWTVNPCPWLPDDRKLRSYARTILWGPTCDSMDMIRRDVFMPELEIGDWVVFDEMGAYTIAAASTFNGFRLPNLKYQLSGRIMAELKSTRDWQLLKQLLVQKSTSIEAQQSDACSTSSSTFGASFTNQNDENRLLPTAPDTEPGDRVEACLINGELSYIRVH